MILTHKFTFAIPLNIAFALLIAQDNLKSRILFSKKRRDSYFDNWAVWAKVCPFEDRIVGVKKDLSARKRRFPVVNSSGASAENRAGQIDSTLHEYITIAGSSMLKGLLLYEASKNGV